LTASGYLHPAYADALSEFGAPRALPRCAGMILQRQIPNSPESDAMGCYPIFVCENWPQLHCDLENLDKELVSLSLVTDPFGEYDVAYLRQCFPDVAIPFKQHFVIDLSRAPDTFVHPHHRRNARKALNEMRVEKCDNPELVLEDWTNLYATLVGRHQIKGIAAFSKQSFAKQLATPGMTAFRAIRDEVTIGMVLWYGLENRAYYHLGAYSPLGYELRASFALFEHSMQYFAEQKIKWLNLGAGAGISDNELSGLSRFKQGWSSGTKTAYFCGRIFAPEKYRELIAASNTPNTDFFPAYRFGEFS
jgi:hypothetical protein